MANHPNRSTEARFDIEILDAGTLARPRRVWLPTDDRNLTLADAKAAMRAWEATSSTVRMVRTA